LLLQKSDVGENEGSYIAYSPDSFTHWIHKSGGEQTPWSLSCEMLIEFRFADLLAPKPNKGRTAILYRTPLGDAFLATVSSPELKS
jgi:hypothetical protein